MALYYIGLACLLTHELDAVTHSEWRLIVGLRALTDPTAATTFVALHLPLFFLVLWFSHHSVARVREGTRKVVAAFLVVHGVLHFALSSAPQNTFDSPFSNSLIFGAAFAGASFLTLALRRRGGNARTGSPTGGASDSQPTEPPGR